MWFLIIITLISSPAQAGTQVKLTQPTISTQLFANEASCKTARGAVNAVKGVTAACVSASTLATNIGIVTPATLGP